MVGLYTNAEYTEMLLVYRDARRNAREACWLYQRRYSNRPQPAHTMFKTGEVFKWNGQLISLRSPHWMPVNIPYTRVWRRGTSVFCRSAFYEHLSGSTHHWCEPHVGLASSAWWVTSSLQTTEGSGDDSGWLSSSCHFCWWLLKQSKQNTYFLRCILFFDECTFTRDIMFNSRNSHVWMEENPHGLHISEATNIALL